jgi:CubicO group peptidase (beta-lactamase class C family)
VELADLVSECVTDDSPGHAVGVYGPAGLIAHASAGLAVLEHGIPISLDTAFDIASASKQFTAACLVLLESDGMLSLNDDIRAHLPELSFPVPVTLRQCLTHTGGLREYVSLCELAGVPLAGMGESRLMPLLAGQTGLNFPPGTGWSYSNSGFVLAAAAVRRLTGMSLAEFASKRLFGPLKMRATRFRDNLAVPVPGLASGYTPASGGGWNRVDLLETMVGDGALITSVNDLARWQDFMLTGAALGAEARDALLEPAVLADGRQMPYALGLEITAVGGHRMYLHAGFIPGFRSALCYLIDEAVGIAVVANRDDTYPTDIAIRIAERITGVRAPAPPARSDLATARAAQDAIAGPWYSPGLDVHVTLVAADDGRLEQAEGDWLYRFIALADGSWRGVADATSIRLRLVAEELWYEGVGSDLPPEIYRRADRAPAASTPTGTYYSEELRAYATLTPTNDGQTGSAAVTIGLAKPRTVTPAATADWAGEGLTLRLIDHGAFLEVSSYGAQRIRFDRVNGAAPLAQRGLTAP